MNIVVFGSGMMGQAIVYDLVKFSNFKKITITDKSEDSLNLVKKNFKNSIEYKNIDITDKNELKNILKKNDIAISAVPYKYNYDLTKICIETKTHFLDLGGNNDIVKKQRSLSEQARKKDVTIIHDCGLAPGLSSVIVKDIVEQMDNIEFIKIRVGGLPIDPKPPLNYQIVFSPNGLINEYYEDAIILENHKIKKKKSMTELEEIQFPKPFGNMEAFLTSGGCSTIPYTYKNQIQFLDYKTIRYPGHCEKFKLLLDLDLGSEKPILVNNIKIIPRNVLIKLLFKNLPTNQNDVVLLKVLSSGNKDGKKIDMNFTMIDYYDEKNKITSMMRTTSYPTSIIAQLIGTGYISKTGVFGCEEIVPCKKFFEQLEKRVIKIKKDIK